MRKIIVFLIFFSFSSSGFALAAGTKKKVSDAKACAGMALKNSKKSGKPISPSEWVLMAKDRYYRYLMNLDLSSMLQEVKDNFETAAEKAEIKFEKEDPSISQSDVLKLKLGLVGVQKDLNEIAKDMERSRLELLDYLGLDRESSLEFTEKSLRKIDLEIPSVESCLKSAEKNHSTFSPLEIETAHIKLMEKNENLSFIREGRKYSRGLLVVALANFDMGIGEGKELFEALYIYNRSVRDYVKGVYEFNMAVEELGRVIGEDLVK